MALGLTPQQIVDKGTHPLLEIKDGWRRIQLQKVAEVQNGYAFKSEFFTRDEGIPLIRIRDINSKVTDHYYNGDYDDSYIVKKNDVLIGMDGDFNVTKWPGEMGLLNQRVCRIKCNTAVYDEDFLFYVLQPYLNAVHAETSAVTVKHLSSKTIKALPIPLPPLPEQRAIVAKLERLFAELDRSVAELETAREKLGVYRQSVLKEAFAGRLTEGWRNGSVWKSGEDLLNIVTQQNKHDFEVRVKNWKLNKSDHIKPKSLKLLPRYTSEEMSKMTDLPYSWRWIKIDKVCNNDKSALKAGPFGSSLKKSDYVETGFKVYGQEQVISGDHTQGDYYINESKYLQLVNCKIEAQDVLISLVGTIGKVLVLPPNCEPGIINPRLVKISLNVDQYLPTFFKYYFESAFAKNLYEELTHGATMSILNLGIIRNIPFPLVPLKEQQQIIEEIETRFSVADKLEQEIAESLERARGLRQGVLKRAFAGELVYDNVL